MREKFTFTRILVVALVLFLVGSVGLAQLRTDASPVKPDTQYRLAAISDQGHVQRVILLEQQSRTMANTTPVNGSTVCIQGDASKYAAQLTLNGTMTGTNPVLTVVLQHSIDGGTTWRQVGSSFAAINATTTPASGREDVAFSDVAASTAVVWGDCYRARYTWGGTGTVTADVGVALIAK